MLSRSALKRSAKELSRIFQAIEKQWAEQQQIEPGDLAGTGRYVRAAGFDSLENVTAMRRHYEHWLSHIPDFHNTVGCDLGCWLGFSTATIASLGCRLVYGIEPITNSARLAEAWRIKHGIENVRFRNMGRGIISLQSSSVDWVLINQVFCNALPDTFSDSLAEAARVVKPGGWLLLSDANNPYCPATLDRLRKNFQRAEIGEGSTEAPDGPNFRQRLQIVRETVSEIDDEVAHRIARETCYMYGQQVVDATILFFREGTTPGSVYRDDPFTPTCIARTGASNGNITDPYALAGEIEKLGFEIPFITCSPQLTEHDNETLWAELSRSQGFFVFARKRAVHG